MRNVHEETYVFSIIPGVPRLFHYARREIIHHVTYGHVSIIQNIRIMNQMADVSFDSSHCFYLLPGLFEDIFRARPT